MNIDTLINQIEELLNSLKSNTYDSYVISTRLTRIKDEILSLLNKSPNDSLERELSSLTLYTGSLYGGSQFLRNSDSIQARLYRIIDILNSTKFQ